MVKIKSIIKVYIRPPTIFAHPKHFKLKLTE